jgi:trimethylamine--corrinoid protein Co-methyltransferase
MADNNSFEQWEAEGALRTEERASKMVKEMLGSYQGPEMDVAKDEELLAFIAQKKSSFPDSNI